MVYRKNVRHWEQVARVVVGLATAAVGFLALPGSALGGAVVGSGLFLGLTGLLGYCPACALVGRKLEQTHP